MITGKQRVEQMKQQRADRATIRARMLEIVQSEDTTPAQKLEAADIILKLDNTEVKA